MNQSAQRRLVWINPVSALCAAVLAGWMACFLWPRLLVLLGISNYGMWYLDSYAVLAALDAVRAGLDPIGHNPLDPLLRGHSYSDWWLALRWLGLTRADNFWVGSVWVGSFVLAVGWTARPRTFKETAFLGLFLLSPPVLLAVIRANNDLVIFVLLAVGGVAAAGTTWVRQLLAVLSISLATGLKFYPAPALLGLLWTRPLRRMPMVLLLATAVTGFVLASVWSQMSRGQFMVGNTVYTMGAALVWRDLGWANPALVWEGPLVIALVAIGLAKGGFTLGLAKEGEVQERLLAAIGSIVLLACFVAGVSYAYRWIFSLWMALWLWRRSTSPAGTKWQRWTWRLGCGLLLLCLWLDGALCFMINRFYVPMGLVRLDQIQLIWRLWTQPLHWLMMMLLAGWLLEGAMVIVRDWRQSGLEK